MKWAGQVGAVAVGVLTLLSASMARAQAQESPTETTFFGWSVSGRLSVRAAPDYLGAKTYSLGPGGSLSFRRPGVQPTFHAPDDSLSLQLLGDRHLSTGVVVRGRSGRDDSGDLHGIHTIHFAIEPGLYVEWWPADALRLRSEVRRGVRGNSAWSGDVSADLVHQDPKWLLSIGPRVHLGDSRFMQTYFDISAADAAHSPAGISPFSASGAFVSAGGLASAEYRWSSRWSVLADVSYERLLGDAADSPIVARLGSPNQFTGSVGVRVRLGR